MYKEQYNKNHKDLKDHKNPKDHKDKKDKKGIGNLDLESLVELLQIAHELKRIFEQGESASEQDIERNIPLMAMLFEYLVAHMDSPNIDPSLLKFLENLLGLDAKKHEKEEELEEEREEELSKEEKEHRYRMAMYEIYKIMNPHQLAGETLLDNFINNVRTRGVEVALKFEGSKYATKFEKSDLENLESHRFGFVQALKDHGVKGGGRGL